MHNLFSQCLLLAERSRLENLSEPFKRRSAGMDPGEMTRALAILAVIIVSAWLVLRLRTARERRRSYNSPLRLFLDLCKAHNLRWSERWLLWRLARAAVERAGAVVLGAAAVRRRGLGVGLACRGGAAEADPRRVVFRSATRRQGGTRAAVAGNEAGGVVAVAVAVADGVVAQAARSRGGYRVLAGRTVGAGSPLVRLAENLCRSAPPAKRQASHGASGKNVLKDVSALWRAARWREQRDRSDSPAPDSGSPFVL